VGNRLNTGNIRMGVCGQREGCVTTWNWEYVTIHKDVKKSDTSKPGDSRKTHQDGQKGDRCSSMEGRVDPEEEMIDTGSPGKLSATRFPESTYNRGKQPTIGGERKAGKPQNSYRTL